MCPGTVPGWKMQGSWHCPLPKKRIWGQAQRTGDTVTCLGTSPPATLLFGAQQGSPDQILQGHLFRSLSGFAASGIPSPIRVKHPGRAGVASLNKSPGTLSLKILHIPFPESAPSSFPFASLSLDWPKPQVLPQSQSSPAQAPPALPLPPPP